MIAILKQNATGPQKQYLIEWFETQGLKVHVSDGEFRTVLGIIGDTSSLDLEMIELLDIVDSVKRITESFKSANRQFHPENSIIQVGNVRIGDGSLITMAGPCAVESEQQILEIAQAVKKSGADILRGGTFKPRTSPYAFQGMRQEGIQLMIKARELTGLPIVTEIMNAEHLEYFEDVDIIQVGARNMQNFELLKALGKIDKPILIKRGMSSTINELLMSAEYVMAGGNEKVILCERGIRTYETATRNTLDLSAVPVLKNLTHLPIIVDPSHATGKRALVEPMSLASVAAGADGLMIEVHNHPELALSDGPQSLIPEDFDKLMTKIRRVKEAIS
ncbi:MAG: 3-deoxy-7-phosphoheptulonate synthase [Peptostreptococcaceae bacterium]|nr:3-deoxy-7-phosphoheptulonate synthase [Peptostreptococcaceae bacterium]